jgi:hypothetical protein
VQIPHKERVVSPPVLFVYADPGKAEHLQDVQVVVLEGNGESENVEFPDRTPALEREELRSRPFVFRDIVLIGQENPLAGGVAASVQDGIDLVHAEVRHAHMVGVGVGQGYLDVNTGRLEHSPPFCCDQGFGLFLERARHAGLYYA